MKVVESIDTVVVDGRGEETKEMLQFLRPSGLVFEEIEENLHKFHGLKRCRHDLRRIVEVVSLAQWRS